MSYDLMVFDPQIAPRDREEFMAWYFDVVRWQEPGRDYNNISGASGNLPDFFNKMKKSYLPMNGADAVDISSLGDEAKYKVQTDYCIATNAIYMAFPWSAGFECFESVVHHAHATDVGFFNVSANDGEIIHDKEDYPKQLPAFFRSNNLPG